MPQLIALALVGGAIWYGYRVFKREMIKAEQEAQKKQARKGPKKIKGTVLEKGEDGVYRPAPKDD